MMHAHICELLSNALQPCGHSLARMNGGGGGWGEDEVVCDHHARDMKCLFYLRTLTVATLRI
jgi:hypothetical protein